MGLFWAIPQGVPSAQLNLTICTIFVIYLFVHLVWRTFQVRFRAGLRDLPGPFLASISHFDRVQSCASGLQMNYHLKLHEKYGPLVRVGPNHVSFSDAESIPRVYGITKGFLKSDFYCVFDIPTASGLVPSIFSVRDESRHKALKRPVAHAYSMGSLKKLEPMNDECSAVLAGKLESRIDQDIDLGKWLHWYAFDVISSITFSNNFGFMEKEKDVDDIITAIEGRHFYNSIIGQVPFMHKYLFGNRLVAWLASFIPPLAKLNSSRFIVSFAVKQVQRHQRIEPDAFQLEDMLALLQQFHNGEQAPSDENLVGRAVGNIIAGSDTTAASLCSLFYYLCRSPHAHERLLNEIDTASQEGLLSDPVTFAEAQRLEYFQAVVKEALRMHPAVGQLLERVVPPGGAEVGGVWLPEGTIVGINPWVAARDKGVYGEDADAFRPERWLEANEQSLKAMDRNSMAFGAGSRMCLGKNISLLEMSKLVPQLLRRFDFELSHPEQKWTLHDYWFVRQKGLICRVRKR